MNDFDAFLENKFKKIKNIKSKAVSWIIYRDLVKI